MGARFVLLCVQEFKNRKYKGGIIKSQLRLSVFVYYVVFAASAFLLLWGKIAGGGQVNYDWVTWYVALLVWAANPTFYLAIWLPVKKWYLESYGDSLQIARDRLASECVGTTIITVLDSLMLAVNYLLIAKGAARNHSDISILMFLMFLAMLVFLYRTNVKNFWNREGEKMKTAAGIR